jgi:serine/threonine protein kinase
MVNQGDVIGNYRITRVLEDDGLAITCEARQTNLSDRRVMLKVLAADLALRPEMVEMFRSEAEIALSLRHPNIAPAFEMGVEAGIHFFSLPFLDGRSLDAIIRLEAITPPAAISIIRQTASALDYAHGRGVLHGDLKPANIIIAPEGRALIVRFRKRTLENPVVGRPVYMAPEYIKDGEMDHRADIYSLGVIAFEMLAGRAPFASDDLHAMLRKMFFEPPPQASSFNPELSESVDIALQGALVVDPQERYYYAGFLADALEEAITGQP